MATDWSARTEALTFFETELKAAKRHNNHNKEHVEQAVNALRRSQDHTAIQNKLKEARNLLIEASLCDHSGSGLCQGCRDLIRAFTHPPSLGKEGGQ
jgi:hypothetical protein